MDWKADELWGTKYVHKKAILEVNAAAWAVPDDIIWSHSQTPDLRYWGKRKKKKRRRNGSFLDGTGVWGRKDTGICMAESLCCPPETITTLLISYLYPNIK